MRPPEKRFYIDFQLYRIAHKINESFIVTSVLPSKFLARSGKLKEYATMGTEKTIQRDLGYLEKMITRFSKNNSTGKCYIVPEGFHPSYYYWHVLGVNRPWLLLSMQRMKQAGLEAKWNDWSTWAARMHHKLYLGGDRSTTESEYINGSQLFCIFLLLIYLEVLGLLVLFFECLSIYNLSFLKFKESLNFILEQLRSKMAQIQYVLLCIIYINCYKFWANLQIFVYKLTFFRGKH